MRLITTEFLPPGSLLNVAGNSAVFAVNTQSYKHDDCFRESMIETGKAPCLRPLCKAAGKLSFVSNSASNNGSASRVRRFQTSTETRPLYSHE